MNKSELIEITAADSGPGARAGGQSDLIEVSAVTDTLSRGEEVTIPGFGKSRSCTSRAHRPPPGHRRAA